jgi:hypothetical protein
VVRSCGVDVDKPRGYVKEKLRRWLRRLVKKVTRKEVADI